MFSAYGKHILPPVLQINACGVLETEFVAVFPPHLRVEMSVIVVKVVHRRRVQAVGEQYRTRGQSADKRFAVFFVSGGFGFVKGFRPLDARLCFRKLRNFFIGILRRFFQHCHNLAEILAAEHRAYAFERKIHTAERVYGVQSYHFFLRVITVFRVGAYRRGFDEAYPVVVPQRFGSESRDFGCLFY